MSIPKYEMIKQELLQEIREHKFIPGDKFYSEADIKQRFDVSSITAVKALNELTAAGYLYRIQGKGTFVSKSKVAANVKFSDIENHPLDTETVTVLDIQQGQQPDILEKLGLDAQDHYYRILRVRKTEDVPFLIHITHLPPAMVQLPLKDPAAFESVYERIHQDFGIDMYALASVETNEVTFPEDPKILNLLNLSFREPAVKQEKITYLADRQVAEYVLSYKHWRYFKTKIEMEAE